MHQLVLVSAIESVSVNESWKGQMINLSGFECGMIVGYMNMPAGSIMYEMVAAFGFLKYNRFTDRPITMKTNVLQLVDQRGKKGECQSQRQPQPRIEIRILFK